MGVAVWPQTLAALGVWACALRSAGSSDSALGALPPGKAACASGLVSALRRMWAPSVNFCLGAEIYFCELKGKETPDKQSGIAAA